MAGVLYEVCFYKMIYYYFAMYQSLFKKALLILSLCFLVVVASVCVCRMPFCLCGSYKNNQKGNRYAAFNFHFLFSGVFFNVSIILYIMYIGYIVVEFRSARENKRIIDNFVNKNIM